MKHILITDGTELIASALCKKLIAQHYQITVISRNPKTVSTNANDKLQVLNCFLK